MNFILYPFFFRGSDAKWFELILNKTIALHAIHITMEREFIFNTFSLEVKLPRTNDFKTNMIFNNQDIFPEDLTVLPDGPVTREVKLKNPYVTDRYNCMHITLSIKETQNQKS